jgi:hypothetical protein
MAEAVYDGFPGDEKHPYEEYGVDLRLIIGTEGANRVVNFISAKPDERKIRSIHLRKNFEYCHTAYYYLNELLWLFESRTPYTILLTDPDHLRKLVLRLRVHSFEGSWLDDVEKLLDIKLENTSQWYLEDQRKLEIFLKESSDQTGEEIEWLIGQKRLAEDDGDDHNKLSDQLLQIIKSRKM